MEVEVQKVQWTHLIDDHISSLSQVTQETEDLDNLDRVIKLSDIILAEITERADTISALGSLARAKYLHILYNKGKNTNG